MLKGVGSTVGYKTEAPSLMKNKGRVVNLGVAGLNTNRASTYMPAYKALNLKTAVKMVQTL